MHAIQFAFAILIYLIYSCIGSFLSLDGLQVIPHNAYFVFHWNPVLQSLMPTTSQWNAPQRSFPKPMLHGLVAGGHGKWVGGNQHLGVEPKIGVVKSPQIIHLFIGFSLIFTIHFGVPLFLVQHPFGNIPQRLNNQRKLVVFWVFGRSVASPAQNRRRFVSRQCLQRSLWTCIGRMLYKTNGSCATVRFFFPASQHH